MTPNVPRPVLAAGLAALGAGFAVLAIVAWSYARQSPPFSPLPAPTAPSPSDDYASLRERGFALFVAKGCPTCHRQQEAEARGYPGVTFGPNLSDLPQRFPAHPESVDYLRRWLKDPSAIKPATAMPTLGLSDEEIEALLHFLLTEAHFVF